MFNVWEAVETSTIYIFCMKRREEIENMYKRVKIVIILYDTSPSSLYFDVNHYGHYIA